MLSSVTGQDHLLQPAGHALLNASQGTISLLGHKGSVLCALRHCVKGRGLVRTVVDWWMVGMDDLVGLFQPW